MNDLLVGIIYDEGFDQDQFRNLPDQLPLLGREMRLKRRRLAKDLSLR